MIDSPGSKIKLIIGGLSEAISVNMVSSTAAHGAT